MIRDIRDLDRVRVLGSENNLDERRRLLDVIDYSSLNSAWSARGSIESFSCGRHGPGADWLYYNLWSRRVATGEETRAYCATDNRPITEGHPRGWDHTAMPSGWAANPVAGGDGVVAGGWSGYVPMVENVTQDDGDDEGPATTAHAVGAGPSGNAGMSAAQATSGAASAVSDVDVIRQFLREFGGVPESILENGTWASFIGYMQGGFA